MTGRWIRFDNDITAVGSPKCILRDHDRIVFTSSATQIVLTRPVVQQSSRPVVQETTTSVQWAECENMNDVNVNRPMSERGSNWDPRPRKTYIKTDQRVLNAKQLWVSAIGPPRSNFSWYVLCHESTKDRKVVLLMRSVVNIAITDSFRVAVFKKCASVHIEVCSYLCPITLKEPESAR